MKENHLKPIKRSVIHKRRPLSPAPLPTSTVKSACRRLHCLPPLSNQPVAGSTAYLHCQISLSPAPLPTSTVKSACRRLHCLLPLSNQPVAGSTAYLHCQISLSCTYGFVMTSVITGREKSHAGTSHLCQRGVALLLLAFPNNKNHQIPKGIFL